MAFTEMEGFVIREISEDSRELLQTRLKKHHEFRCKFEVASTLSTSSSMAAAKLVAKEEVVKLKLKQLEEKRELERKQQRQRRCAEEERRREDEEREEEQFNLELLKARHKTEEASLERQVIEEEIERGGYIPSESENKPLKSDIPTSSRVLSAKGNSICF